MEATKKPSRDFPSFSSNPWSLWDTIYARRSCRKYLPFTLSPELVGGLEEFCSLAAATRGASQESLVLVTDPVGVDRIRRGAYKGVGGKINLWLLRAPVSSFLLLALPRADVENDRPQELPLTTAAVEDVVLWLTEAGLATCWLGGVSDREVRKAIGLGDEFEVPAIISIGKTKERIKARDLDSFLYHRLSRHRKPIRAIASHDSFGEPFALSTTNPDPFTVSDVQDVEGLERRLSSGVSGPSEVPLELATEACLEAARVAPNGGNLQRWHFTVITAPEKVREMALACGKSDGWSTAIAGAGYGGKLYGLLDKPFWMLDLPIAFSNMSLMAASMNMDFDLCFRECDEKSLDRLTGIPSELRTAGVFGLKS